MAGIYIHIPFCKQACHYCNFHFTTSLRYKDELLRALHQELSLQKHYTGGEKIETLYFGGGTPSLLSGEETALLITSVKKNYDLAPDAEITLEANPDDVQQEKLSDWKAAGINRLSIGIQSFFEEDLQWMNRAHTAGQAQKSLEAALAVFPNITIDLIYGTPGLSHEKWKANVERAIAMNVPHLSCYALTVEPKTPLDKLIRQSQKEGTDPDLQSEQFLLLMQWLEDAGYEHYEISNFAKPGWRSRHNSSYWSAGPRGGGKKYLGIGPSAHSYNGTSRQWNLSNNQTYIQQIAQGKVPFELETLSPAQQLNEYIMTSLRTAEGLQLDQVEAMQAGVLREKARRFEKNGLIFLRKNSLILTREGKLLADGIAAALFTE